MSIIPMLPNEDSSHDTLKNIKTKYGYKKKELPPLTPEQKELNKQINSLPIKQQIIYWWKNGDLEFKISFIFCILFIIIMPILGILSKLNII